MHKRFLTSNATFELVVNVITSVINPSLYSAGLQAQQSIQTFHSSSPWFSVWSGIALIVNRETPSHWDSGGSLAMHDLLVSAGTHQACYLDVDELGAEFLYLPGTILALSGKALSHQVKSWAGGERICAAHFMRDSVHHRLGLVRPTWPSLDDYLCHT